MSKLGTLMRDSISAEKQSVEQKPVVSNTEIVPNSPNEQGLQTHSKAYVAQNFVTDRMGFGFVHYYYSIYGEIIQSQCAIFELIQKEQISIMQNNISSGFAILNSFKTGIKSLKS